MSLKPLFQTFIKHQQNQILMLDYEKLLEKAQKDIPETARATQRFEIPKVTGHIQGNKTIITNFSQIVQILHRDQNHLLKYLQRELATPAFLEGQRLVLGRKINSTLINTKIQKYAEEFVLCKDCKKPDTKLERENKILVMKCHACGAKHPIKSKI
tara:strand:+ start:32 stop:499 length:468 start_codon:yes stop_codon:yes gene_type:complete